MKAIVQKVKNIISAKFEIDNGLIVYIFDMGDLENILIKVEKIKMWNDWKNTVLDLKYTVFVVAPEEINSEDIMKINIRKDNMIFLEKKYLRYVNDGPCTFILN